MAVGIAAADLSVVLPPPSLALTSVVSSWLSSSSSGLLSLSVLWEWMVVVSVHPVMSSYCYFYCSCYCSWWWWHND